MDNAENVKNSTDDETKTVKRNLEGWREVLLPIHSVMVWEKPFYPGILATLVTFIFILIWYCDLSVLSSLSIFGIVFSLLDYIVPLVSSSVFDPNQWSGAQEQRYEEICNELAHYKHSLVGMWHSAAELKESKPKVYFAVALASLVLFAWIGNVFDNLFLTYLTVLFLVMVPGMKRNGTIQKFVAKGAVALKEKLGKAKKN